MPEPLTNRLAGALSPYLQQHAHNPVAWQEWGDEAFALARALDRPIFLSIGYATCHWCHVMAHESFEDEAVAAHLNRVFVPVKVDREERPDVDAIYMEACQMMTGHGGWPLTVLVTPDGKPFYTATYLPPRARHNRPGVVELCEAVEGAWQQRRPELLGHAEALTDALQTRGQPREGTAPEAPGEETLGRALALLRQRYDARWGGWGGAPKFPTPHVGRFLLRHAARKGAPEAVEMVVKTLHAMRSGGLFDQLGGGFHRYSTDAEWRLPHFEKMLYDQAGLLLLYAEAYHATGDEAFAATVRDVVTYLTRDLQHASGAFFSAEDADSEGREGAFYLWTLAEVEAVLGADDAAFFARAYDVHPEGNFEDEASRQRTGENVLYRTGTAPTREDEARLAALRNLLFRHRAHRPRPLLDDKILTDWNGLAVAALARAGVLLEDSELIRLAARAMDFVLDTLRGKAGLLHRYRNGEAGIPALADDYAFTIWGLLELHQATQAPRWLVEAAALQRAFDAACWNGEVGAYRLQPAGGETLIAQTITFYDGATPSANSVAAQNLLRLARLTGDLSHTSRARTLLATAAAELHAYPAGHAHLLLALDEEVNPPPEVVLAARDAAEAAPFVEVVRSAGAPGTLVVVLDSGRQAALRSAAPALAAYEIPKRGVLAFVCQNQQCHAPVRDVAALTALL